MITVTIHEDLDSTVTNWVGDIDPTLQELEHLEVVLGSAVSNARRSILDALAGEFPDWTIQVDGL